VYRLAVVACSVALVLSACSEGWTVEEMEGRVVFAGGGEEGLLNIHLYDFATGEARAVTDGRLHGNAPVLSPDGSRIVFHGVPDGDVENGNWDIYTVNTDGTDLFRVTTGDEMDLFPDWSPDGTRIVFEKERADRGRDLFILNADGTGEERLTDRPGEDGSAAWSPDGIQIAFNSDRDGEPAACRGFGSMDCNVEIYLMDIRGTKVTRITNSGAVIDGFPEWSPDGTQLVIHSNTADPPWGFDIHTIDLEGNDMTQITADPANLPDGTWYSESNPSWSPDGNWIIFNSDEAVYEDTPDPSMQRQLYICDTSGNQRAILETGILDASWADWGK
jgi:TolB protein